MKYKKYRYINHLFNKWLNFYSYPFCEKWDTQLNHLIDHAEKIELTDHEMIFHRNGKIVKAWISNANKFHCYGLWSPNEDDIGFLNMSVRPSFETMNRLYQLEQKLIHEKILNLFKTEG